MSKDVITEEDCNEAEQCFQDYVKNFQGLFGVVNMRYNIYILTHIVDCARERGPLSCQSNFFFESLNHQLNKAVKSPKGVVEQIVNRYLIKKFLTHAAESADISNRVKYVMDRIMNGSSAAEVKKVEDVRLYGRSTQRMPTEAEKEALTTAGFNTDQVVEYDRAIFNEKYFPRKVPVRR